MPKSPLDRLMDNMRDVDRLMEIHADLTGGAAGRRSGVEVLNKSAIILITASWEALVEDLAVEAFDFIIGKAENFRAIPKRVRVLASNQLKADRDDSAVWKLAGKGWRQVLEDHRKDVVARLVGPLNTPNAENVDRLFREMLDLKSLSDVWKWHLMTPEKARRRLAGFIKLRGEIAHRAKPDQSVRKSRVIEYRNFVFRIAVKSSNKIRGHVHGLAGGYPWSRYGFGSVS